MTKYICKYTPRYSEGLITYEVPMRCTKCLYWSKAVEGCMCYLYTGRHIPADTENCQYYEKATPKAKRDLERRMRLKGTNDAEELYILYGHDERYLKYFPSAKKARKSGK